MRLRTELAMLISDTHSCSNLHCYAVRTTKNIEHSTTTVTGSYEAVLV